MLRKFRVDKINLQRKGDRFIFTTLISATAPTLNYSKQITRINHAPLPRHREVPLRHLRWSLHARKVRVKKINLSPLWSCPLYGRMRNVRVEALRSLAPGQNL